jgi:inosose dehydratase
MTASPTTPLVALDRIGGAPISWGVCEVPGWGVMLPVERVLGEMRQVGITAIELGAPGFLPRDPDALREVLDAHGMRFIGGFVPLVLHDAACRAETLAEAATTAELFRAAGASVFVTAVVADAGWAPRFELDASQWDHLVGMLDELEALCSDAGLTHALHPHVGTLVETAADVATVLERSDVRWCLDTGHLAIGGYDPARFADDAAGRVTHVHLKDVDGAVAAEVAAGVLSIREGVQQGLFCPLGAGDVPIAGTVAKLAAAGYDGWYVIEQDADLGPVAPAEGQGPMESAIVSLDYLRSLSGNQP